MGRLEIASISTAAFVSLIVSASPTVCAQEREIYMREGASPQEYIDALQRTRGLRPVTAKQEQEPREVAKALPAAVSVKIYFPFNSAELTPEAKAELDNLGAALGSPEFSKDRWRIEGHTDASGSVVHNQSLSERRAMSVYTYLVTKHRVNPRQFVPVGKGERELYDPERPFSAVNRRVRITYLGG